MSKQIKVVDFAYPSGTLQLSPIPEIFDQYLGIAEVEYYWNQPNRTFAIPGKTLSRLLELHWISETELSTRAAPIDLIELQKHDSRQPPYPWRALSSKTPPTPAERNALLQSNISFFENRDAKRLKWAMKVKAGKFGALTECPKQYPAPLHAYNHGSYPELGQHAEGNENVPQTERKKLCRTETLLHF
jgi:hypothetical protein